MHTIIAVRHGEYQGENGGLNSQGIEQVNLLVPKFGVFVRGQKVAVFSGQALRAVQTAEIIANAFGQKNTVERSLGNEYGFVWAEYIVDWITSSVDKDTVDVLIIVTHGPTLSKFPGLYGEKVLGWGPYFKENAIKVGSGQAVRIDCTGLDYRPILLN